jgi:hypothetical protein
LSSCIIKILGKGFMNKVIHTTGMSNRQFLETYASPGRVGLAGGSTLINKAIGRAQRHIDPDKTHSQWAHAFLLQGIRHDKHHWVIESDLEVHRRNIRIGVQENRLEKFHDESIFGCLAILDFGLTPEQTDRLLARGLELVALRTRYSIMELLGTLFALRHPSLRTQHNLLAKRHSFYCSAFVHHLFRTSGLDLATGLDEKNTTPEDLWRSLAPHTTYVLDRPPGQKSKLLKPLRKLSRRKIKATG